VEKCAHLVGPPKGFMTPRLLINEVENNALIHVIGSWQQTDLSCYSLFSGQFFNQLDLCGLFPARARIAL